MRQEKDMFIAARFILEASKILYDYYPEVSDPLLEISKGILEKIDIDQDVDKYVDMLTGRDEEEEKYEKILREETNVENSFDIITENAKEEISKEYENIKNNCEDEKNKGIICVPEEVKSNLENIRAQVLEELNRELEE